MLKNITMLNPTLPHLAKLYKKTSLLKVTNLATNTVVVEELEAPLFEKGKVTLTLKENPQEYFYGGGVQNGRFSHKGKVISCNDLRVRL